MTHEFEVPTIDLSVPLCVGSGQVFRWRETQPGVWLGVEGDVWYRVCVGDRLHVESNRPKGVFESFFRLDWDAEEIRRRVVELGPEMAPFVEELSGLRLLRPTDPAETFICFLCTPNNNITRITGMVRYLAGKGPVMEELDGEPLHRFPDPETVASLPEQELRANGFGYRGASIPKAVRALAEKGGREYLETLKKVPYEEAHAALCDIPGIGPKLADCIALFSLDHTLAVPVDTHIWQAAVRLYFPQWRDTALTDAKYKEIGAFFRGRFGELTGWAHQYLFYENMLNWRTRRASS